MSHRVSALRAQPAWRLTSGLRVCFRAGASLSARLQRCGAASSTWDVLGRLGRQALSAWSVCLSGVANWATGHAEATGVVDRVGRAGRDDRTVAHWVTPAVLTGSEVSAQHDLLRAATSSSTDARSAARCPRACASLFASSLRPRPRGGRRPRTDARTLIRARPASLASHSVSLFDARLCPCADEQADPVRRRGRLSYCCYRRHRRVDRSTISACK
jgi:hypothetical protein